MQLICTAIVMQKMVGFWIETAELAVVTKIDFIESASFASLATVQF